MEASKNDHKVKESRNCKEETHSGENANLSRLEKENHNWSRFAEWVHCMCAVTFDLEIGQAIEVIYPENYALSEREKTNICYLAFPDSNSGCMGDTQFHVRLRVCPDVNYQDDTNNRMSFQHKRFNSQCLTVQKADKAHYWGFVYFRQRKEASLPRGYFQKSFIVLTRLPFFNLFYEMLSLLAPMYFRDGLSAMESACFQICDWPALRAGESLSLPLFNIVFQTVIPQANSKGVTINNSHYSNSIPGGLPVVDTSNCPLDNQRLCDIHPLLQPKVISSISEINIYKSVSCVISHIYTLWELVLIAEPIVVIGSSPADTSHMVQSLVSFIAPLEYCAESRPYFTIHDSEFKEFTREYGQFSVPPSIIIGVTNPFFVKLLKDWPHMIRISMSEKNQINQSGGDTPHPKPRNVVSVPLSDAALHSVGGVKRTAPTDSNAKCVITKYKPFLKKDKALIKKILLGINTKRPDHVQSALLRRNLLELTQSFMIPLERYMASLMPLQKDISPFKSAPSPNQFKQNDFLATLEQSGPHLTSPLKGNWKGLYKRFFQSPNFKGWYENRHRELQQTLQALQLQALSGADLNQWAQGKQEVEIIDMIIKLKQKLNLCATEGSNNSLTANMDDKRNNIEAVGCSHLTETRQQLLRQIESMKQSLPDDLKTILFDT